MTLSAAPAAAVLADGYAQVELDSDGAAAVAGVLREARRFFTMSADRKLRHGSPDFNYGFRPQGRQYSVTPDRPDLNESFTYWASSPELVPEHGAIDWFLSALETYRSYVARVVHETLDGIAARLGAVGGLPFEGTSYLEVNWYPTGQERDLLQDRHEDGHLLTVATSTGPGLEIEVGGRMVGVDLRDGLLLMPGSLLTDMTGGAVAPLFHQVRTHRLPSRLTVLYLVNPPLDREVRPFVVNEGNADLDIALRARTNGAMFGLPEAPALPSG